MSLSGFQLALCDAIANRELAQELRNVPDRFLDRYELTAKESRRLLAMRWQPGFRTSSAIYRLNRITPLCEYLPMTTLILGDEIVLHAEAYWSAHGTDLQFAPEVAGFGAFLSERCRSGVATHRYLADVLTFEIAINELRFLSDDIDRGEPARCHVNPFVRIVAFAHEPLGLLEPLGAGHLPDQVSPGEHYVLIDGREGGLAIVPVANEFGHRFVQIFNGATADLTRHDDQALCLAELLIVDR